MNGDVAIDLDAHNMVQLDQTSDLIATNPTESQDNVDEFQRVQSEVRLSVPD